MSDSAAVFWRTFEEKAGHIRKLILSGKHREAFNMVEHLLADHGYDFSFDLTEQDGLTVMILSPEGDRSEAARIDSLIASKPPMPKWIVYGRRQRKPLEDVYAIIRHIYDLDVEDAKFVTEDAPGGLNIMMYSKAFVGLNDEESKGLVATCLDHALGEDFVMSQIGGMRGSPAGNSSGMSARELIDSLL